MLRPAKLDRWSWAVAAILFVAACEDARTPVQPPATQFDNVATGRPEAGDRARGQTECKPHSRGQSGVSCVAFTSVRGPIALEIDGHEGRVAVSASNEGRATVSGLLVEAWILQGSARRWAGSSAPFSCGPGPCTIPAGPSSVPAGQFNVVASNEFPGTGTLLCGPATMEIDLTHDGTLLQTVTTTLTISHSGGCLRPERAALSPTTLEIGGLEGTATVTVENDNMAPVSDLVVQGWIVQGTARRAAGNSAPFTCASGSCVQQFNFVANNDFPGTGTLVCGSATAEFDLMQGDTPRQRNEIAITLSKPGGCP